MKRQLVIILMILCYINTFSQHSSGDTLRRVYTSIKNYKERYKNPLTKKDSLNFVFKDGDTLVLIENYVRPKGISVPYEYKDSTFLHYYQKIAFRTIGIDSVDKKQSMRYWKDDIRIFFSESVSKKVRKNFMSFTASIANQVDSLQISEVKSVEDSNYVIFYKGDYDYEPRIRKNKDADYYIYWNDKSQIYRGSIMLNTELYFNDNLIEAKLKEYFISNLGYFNKINDFSCESYFANCYSNNKEITPLDIELIQYHYSYGICKGTTLETFKDQHKRAKETLKSHNQVIRFYHTF